MRVLIVYGTTEGHTRDICRFVHEVLAESGIPAVVVDAAEDPPEPGSFDLCLVAASLHVGTYQPAVAAYARRHHERLGRMPAAFISVSLSAAGENPDDWEGLKQCVDRFTHQTCWTPTVVHHVAGAIRYSQYDFFKRLALKFIARKRGQATVTTRDYDLTDYSDLRRFVLALVTEHGDRETAAPESA